MNAVAGLPVLFATAGVAVDNATTGLLRWTGWVVMGVGLAVAELVVGRTRPDEPPGRGRTGRGRMARACGALRRCPRAPHGGHRGTPRLRRRH